MAGIAMIEASIILIFALIGGWLSRMCGGAPPKLPWGLDQWLYALPYLVISLPASLAVAALASTKKENRKYFSSIALLPYTAAFLGKRTGHGGGMDLATNNKEPGQGREAERLEFLILPLHGKISQYWYDTLLLAITGIAVTLLAGILVMFVSFGCGLLLAISGLSKAPAYMIGALIYPDRKGRGIPHLNEATAIGEFLTGFFAYGVLAFIALRLFTTEFSVI